MLPPLPPALVFPYNTSLFNYTQTEVIFTATIGSLSLVTLLLTGILIYCHLSYYVSPRAQTHIIRIVAMAPIYTINSLLSILFHRYAVYFDLARDCYEAFVLYQFFALLLHYFNTEAINQFPENTESEDDVRLRELRSLSDHGGGDSESSGSYTEESEEEVGIGNTQYFIEAPIIVADDATTTCHYLAKVRLNVYPFPCCCCSRDTPGNVLFVRIRRCVFQYIVVKPLLSMVAAILYTLGLYVPSSFGLKSAYMWIALVTNLSIFVALYYLLIFYNLTHHVIKQHRPLSKFLAIKTILFFVFWQSVLIAALAYLSWLPILDTHSGEADVSMALINNLIIAVEMTILALVNFFAFPFGDYRAEFLYTTTEDPNATDTLVDDDTQKTKKKKRTKRKKYTSKRAKNMLRDVLNPLDIVKEGKDIIRGKDIKIL